MKKNKFRNRPNRNQSRKKNFRKKAVLDISKYISDGFEVEEAAYNNDLGFEDFELSLELLKRIRQKGYDQPTEIQEKSIPTIMTGQDLIGIAGTGTGKTAAFLIPIIQDLMEDPMNNKVLVVTPTRELASQIYDEFRSLTKGLKLFATCLIGGNPVHKSIKELQRLNHLVIGTPGRLLDMTKRGHLRLQNFETLVLDEFDRMLDMGFIEDVKTIDGQMMNKDQTLLFSATMEKGIRHIVEEMTFEAVEVQASGGIRPSNSIRQEVLYVPKERKKIDFVHDLIQGKVEDKIILFCGTKRKVDQLHKKLDSSNIRTDMIHGDKSQRAREVALRKFKSGKINVLIATDVIARGIDVDDVSLVINYEIPQEYTDYIHRIGRTGRAGKKGKAITIVD